MVGFEPFDKTGGLAYVQRRSASPKADCLMLCLRRGRPAHRKAREEMNMPNILLGIGIVLGLCCVGMVHRSQALSADAKAALKTEKDIYVATKRKNGEWSNAAPIWFMYDGEALYFTTSPSAYKAKRIKRGSPVKVWVGGKDGLSFTGKAEIITDSAIVARMGEAYSQKYWVAWLGLFRPRVDRVESGKTVAVKVTPLLDEAGTGMATQ